MRIVAESLEELPHVLVHVGVVRDVVHELIVLALAGELAVSEEPRNLEEGRAFRELLDGVASVAEYPLVAVDVGDRAATRRGVQERRVVAEEPGVVLVISPDLLEI